MWYRLAADLTFILHALFIVFVVCGGLLCLHRFSWAVVHLPAVAWGIWIEVSGGICPLTPLENHYLRLAGEQGYQGGYIDHYLIPIIYPAGLTRNTQWMIAVLALVINLAIYTWIICRRRKQSSG